MVRQIYRRSGVRVIRVVTREFCEEGEIYKCLSIGILGTYSKHISVKYVVSPVPQRMHCMERSEIAARSNAFVIVGLRIKQVKVPSTGNGGSFN